MRSSKSGGGSVWPAECPSIESVPFDLDAAINHANLVLSWKENLISDEMPPEWMWPFGDLLNEWFEEVAFAREQKYGGSGDDYAEMDRNALLDD